MCFETVSMGYCNKTSQPNALCMQTFLVSFCHRGLNIKGVLTFCSKEDINNKHDQFPCLSLMQEQPPSVSLAPASSSLLALMHTNKVIPRHTGQYVRSVPLVFCILTGIYYGYLC